MKCITGRYVWLLAIGYWLLAACSSDGTDEQRASSVLQVTPYMAAYQNHHALSRRAVSEGYTLYTPDHDISIGLYVLPEDNPTPKLIRYSNDVWHSQATVQAITHTICGYMPKSITSSISLSGGDILLTLTDVPAVSADDVCFVTGIKDGKIEDAGDLLQGNFTYVGNSDNNYICLLMDHLFASVKFNYTVDPEYSALRTIKLKSMQLQTTAGSSVTATVTLHPNTEGADPVTSVYYADPLTGTSTATFFEDAAGIDINTDAATIRNFSCCFAPGLSNNLTLVTTYDVYDRYNNKIREDCQATNQLPNLGAVRGECWTINLNVAPTYLGQLSEKDLDDLTFTVN